VGQKLEHRISAGQADHDSRHHFPLMSSYRQQFRGARNRPNKVRAGMSCNKRIILLQFWPVSSRVQRLLRNR
jgi:hypothetical protein